MAKKYDHDGDLYVQGSLVVLGGIKNANYSSSVTRIAKTSERTTVVEAGLEEAQGDIADLEEAVAEAVIRLSVTPTVLSRSRSGILTPPTILMQASLAYLGRFTVELSHNGVLFQDPSNSGYASAADENSYTFTVPPTVDVTDGGVTTTYNTLYARVTLYKAGGFTVSAGSIAVTISMEASTAPMYWGPLDTAPTVNIIAGDYYFDSNTVALGGGVLRIYTEAGWVEYTGTMAGYSQAAWAALSDMSQWSLDQSSVVSAANGIFAKLFAYEAYLANIFAKTITVATGGSIQYETGAGVQKRCVQLADEKIDWLDIPDTTPATPEQLRFRLGRLGVGGAVLADGELLANIEAPWSDASVVNSALSEYPSIAAMIDGTLRVSYGTYPNIYERIGISGVWSSASLISSGGFASRYCYGDDGILRLAYIRDSDKKIVEIIYDEDTSTWSSETVLSDLTHNNRFEYKPTKEGTRVLVYRNETTGIIEMKEYISGAWTSAVEVSSVPGFSPAFISAKDGTRRFSYSRSSDNYLIEKVYSSGTWGAEAEINSAYTSFQSYVQTIDEQIRVAYQHLAGASAILNERVLEGGVWSDATTIVSTNCYSPNYAQSSDGVLNLVYERGGTTYLEFRTLQRYARVGAGIVADDGANVIFGNGFSLPKSIGEFPSGLAIRPTDDISIVTRANEVGSNNTTYVKYREHRVNASGTMRFTWNLYLSGSYIGRYGYGRIYKNGVAFGPEHSVYQDANFTFSDDLIVSNGDLIQLYLHGSGTVNCKNNSFAIRCVLAPTQDTIL